MKFVIGHPLTVSCTTFPLKYVYESTLRVEQVPMPPLSYVSRAQHMKRASPSSRSIKPVSALDAGCRASVRSACPGYQVLTSSDASSALLKASSHEPTHLLISALVFISSF